MKSLRSCSCSRKARKATTVCGVKHRSLCEGRGGGDTGGEDVDEARERVGWELAFSVGGGGGNGGDVYNPSVRRKPRRSGKGADAFEAGPLEDMARQQKGR